MFYLLTNGFSAACASVSFGCSESFTKCTLFALGPPYSQRTKSRFEPRSSSFRRLDAFAAESTIVGTFSLAAFVCLLILRGLVKLKNYSRDDFVRVLSAWSFTAWRIGHGLWRCYSSLNRHL